MIGTPIFYLRRALFRWRNRDILRQINEHNQFVKDRVQRRAARYESPEEFKRSSEEVLRRGREVIELFKQLDPVPPDLHKFVSIIGEIDSSVAILDSATSRICVEPQGTEHAPST